MKPSRWLGLVGVTAIVGVVAVGYFWRTPSLPRVGFLGMDSKLQVEMRQAFEDGMRALGDVDGKNVHILYRWGEVIFKPLPEVARELAALKVDVIVAAAPPAVKAAQRATTTIPIVMGMHSPVIFGTVDSLRRPGKNITGVAFQDSELSTKRLEYLRQLVPDLSRVAVIWNDSGGGADAVKAVEAAAIALGVVVRAYEVNKPEDFAVGASSARSWGAQAVLQLASPVISLHRQVLLNLLAEGKIPAACERRLYVVEGCLMTYSASYAGMMFRLAYYTDRILKGERPSHLPVEQPREFEFVINEKTAKALDLVVPPSLQVLATEVLR